MKTTARGDTIGKIEELADAQHGFFTRAQARDLGVHDVQLLRAVQYGQIRRLDHGIYRVVGAGIDEHGDLRVMWLRLDPRRRPRERTRNPTLWVSHQSAAVLLGLGVFIPPVHEFVSTTRKQLRAKNVRVRVHPNGLEPNDWVIRSGMATTSPLKTLIDLDQIGTDGGHLGTYLRDALQTGAIQGDDLDGLHLHSPAEALLGMAGQG